MSILRSDSGILRVSEGILKAKPFTVIKYGLLYNWYALADTRKITSSDNWIVPNDEWLQSNRPSEILYNYVSSSSYHLRSTGLDRWDNTNGLNTYNFNAAGSGYRGENGAFSYLKRYFIYWSSVEQSSSKAYNSGCYYTDEIFNATRYTYSQYADKKRGYSIRLIKTSTTLQHGEEGIYIGNDGKKYRTICIGTQEWLADNLCETKYRNGDTIPEVTSVSTWSGLTSGACCAFDNDWSNP